MFKLLRWLPLVSAAFSLSGCIGSEAPEATLYATSVESANSILMNAEVPKNVLGSESIQADYQVSTDHGDGQSVIWHFSKQNYNVISVEAKLSPETPTSTRVALEVRFIDGPGFAQLPGAPALVEAAKNMPHLKEAIRQNFLEFVDATMTGRPYQASHGGSTYALVHVMDIASETAAFSQALRKASIGEQARAEASETYNRDGTVYHNNTRPDDFGKPAMDAKPSMTFDKDRDQEE